MLTMMMMAMKVIMVMTMIDDGYDDDGDEF